MPNHVSGCACRVLLHWQHARALLVACLVVVGMGLPRLAAAQTSFDTAAPEQPTADPKPPDEAAPTDQTPPPPRALPPASAPLAAPPGYQLPLRLPYEDGDPVPAGYHVEERRSNALIYSGVAVWGASYLAALVGGAGSDTEGSGWLMVPLVGPFGAVFQQRVVCDASTDIQNSTLECSDKIVTAARRSVLLLVDGLAQLTGATLLTVGLTNTDKQLVRDEPAVVVTPRLEPGAYGLTVSGVF